MSASELFPDSSVIKLSPRLEWLKKYNFALGQLPEGQRFCACTSTVFVADTHKECELKMAEYLGVEHWEKSEFKKAGVTMPENMEEDWG